MTADGDRVNQLRTAARSGLRQFFAAIAARLQITAADLPRRSPVDAGHWEHRPDAELPDVPLPRGVAPVRVAAPAAQPSAVTH